MKNYYSLGIDIGSTTVKIAILDENNNILFSDYKRHYANIQETLTEILKLARTAADLQQSPDIQIHHLASALNYTRFFNTYEKE